MIRSSHSIMDMQMFQLMIVTALGLTAFSLPAHSNVMIIIDKGAQSMSVIVDGDKRWVWLVSTGREGYATPEGSYNALKMEEIHTFKERNEPSIPHAIFFTKQGHAIHGTYEVRRLGTPASHGLVRTLGPVRSDLVCRCEATWIGKHSSGCHGSRGFSRSS